MLCSVILTCLWFVFSPKFFFVLSPLPACYITEQSKADVSLFVNSSVLVGSNFVVVAIIYGSIPGMLLEEFP